MSVSDRISAYWPFDSTHGRTVTFEYTGTYTIDGGTAGTAAGKVRQALSLEADNSEFRSVSDAAGLRQLKGCTVWVKLESKAADMSIVAKGSTSANADHSMRLWYDQSEDVFSYTVGDDTTATTVSTTGLTISTDTWYFIRCATDGERQTIWVDETLYGAADYRAPFSETGTFYIGRDTSGNYFDGLIDELAVYSTAPTRSDGAVFHNGGDGISLPEFDELPGPSGRGGFCNRWKPPTFAESDDGVLYVASGKRRVQAFDGYGDFRSAGVPSPAVSPTMDSSGTGRIIGDLYGYVRFLDSDSRVSSMSPISDVLRASGDSRGSITGATNAAPIVITSASHGLTTGTRVRITGQQGNTAANGFWYVTSVDSNSFSLDGSVGNGDWLASPSPNLTITEQQKGRAAVNEVQTLSISGAASGGSFTLTFDGEESAAIDYNASAATIEGVLDSMGSVGNGNVSCAGGAVGSADVTFTFSGDFAGVDVPLLTADTTNLLGADVTLSVVTLTEGNAGTDEVQTFTLYGTPTGGTFTLTYDGQTTGAIAYNASAATVDTALEALSNIGAGDVAVTGGPLPGSALTITFGGALADTDVAEITCDPGSLTGGSISVSVAETTAGAAGLDDDLEHFWTCDQSSGDRYDSVGTADISGSLAAVTGHINNGMRVANVSAAVARSSNVTTSSSFSIAGWFLINSGGPSFVVGDDNLGTSVSSTWLWSLTYSSVLSRFQATMQLSNGSNKTVNADTFGAPSTGTWYFLCMTYNHSTETMGISVNAGSEDTVSVSGWNNRTGLAFKFLSSTLSSSGSMDEVAYYSKVLSSAERTSLYNSGTGRSYPLPGGTNEVQTITINGTPSQGTFTLTYSGQTTEAIAYNASAATVETELESLSSIGSDNVSCGGGPLPGSNVTVTFQNTLGNTDVDLMTANDDLLQYSLAETTEGSPAQSEVQRISASPAPISGTWTVTFDSQTTSSLDYDISASALQTALEGLSSIGSGNISVTGGPLATAPFVCTCQGALANADQNAMTTADSLLGAVPTITITETTKGKAARNEIQQITVDNVSSGTFTLTYSGQTTAALQFDATASDVDTELEGLSNIDAVTVTGGPLTEEPINVEFAGTLASTDVGLMTADVTSLYNGGWATGASEIEYTNVAVPTDTRVTRKQILRTKPGNADVAYIDVDTTDISLSSFVSTNTDEDLTAATLVVLRDSDGVDHNLNRHDEPPDWKTSISAFQNRLFVAGDYVEDAGAAQIDGTDADGIATDWPSIFDARSLYVKSASDGYVIDTIDADDQQLTLTNNAETSSTTDDYQLMQAPPEGQRLYHSWLTASDAYPESFYLLGPFQVARDTRDGAMVGTFSFDGRIFIAFENTIYRYSFETDPAQAPVGDGRAAVAVPRGLANPRCVAYADDIVYCLDHQGIYRFDGSAVEGVSQLLKPMFVGEHSAYNINWRYADFFHAAYFPSDRTVRFWVVLGGGPYPQHAICLNIDTGAWWLEEYPYAITASTTALIDGELRVLLGASGRRIFTLDGSREGTRSVTDVVRGTATSAGISSLTDSGAAFTSSLVGLPVEITEGTGRGQRRIISSVTSTTLYVAGEWGIRPSTDSVYQVGGVSWSVRTGKLRYTNSGRAEVRGVEVVWTPVSNSQTLAAVVRQDFSVTGQTAQMTRAASDADGFSVTAGDPHFTLNMTRDGTATFRISGQSRPNTSSPALLDVEVDGVTNGERHELHVIAVSGAT